MPAAAPALRAPLPDRNCAAARIAAWLVTDAAPVGPVGRVMWNMRKIHFSHSCKTAAARMAVKGGRSLPAAKRACPLTATAAEATRASARRDAGSDTDPLLSTGLRRSNLGYSRRNRAQAVFLLAA